MDYEKLHSKDIFYNDKGDPMLHTQGKYSCVNCGKETEHLSVLYRIAICSDECYSEYEELYKKSLTGETQ